MARGPRKYPARQEIIDKAKALGWDENTFSISDYTHTSYRNGYTSTDCVRVRFDNGPTILFNRATGAIVKAEGYNGGRLSKVAVLKELADRCPAAMKAKEEEARRAQEQRRAKLIEDVAENYAHKCELEKIAVEYAVKVVMESGIERAAAIDVVLSLVDAKALDKIVQSRQERERAGDGWLPNSRYSKEGTWENGQLVSW